MLASASPITRSACSTNPSTARGGIRRLPPLPSPLLVGGMPTWPSHGSRPSRTARPASSSWCSAQRWDRCLGPRAVRGTAARRPPSTTTELDTELNVSLCSLRSVVDGVLPQWERGRGPSPPARSPEPPYGGRVTCMIGMWDLGLTEQGAHTTTPASARRRDRSVPPVSCCGVCALPPLGSEGLIPHRRLVRRPEQPLCAEWTARGERDEPLAIEQVGMLHTRRGTPERRSERALPPPADACRPAPQ